MKHSRDVTLIAAAVYFVQGAIGISGIAFPIFLRSLNWSVAEITAMTSVAAFPWVFKILLGLVSDACPLFGYRRKSYLMLCSLISALGWFYLVAFPAEKSWIFLGLLLSNLGFAATDVITDGLIVEHSTLLTSHIYQAIAWGFRSFGAVVSGAAGGWLAAHWHPRHIFLLTMALPLIIFFSAIWIRERKVSELPFRSALIPAKRCLKLLWNENLRGFALILLFVSISASFGMPFFFFMKETLGFHETFLGLLMSLGWGGAMIGSFVYAKWLRKFPPKLILRWALFLNSINIFTTLLITDRLTAFLIIFAGGVMGCLVMLPIMSAAACLTHNSGVEGTLFAVLMSIFNLGQIVFGFLGGKIFSLIGLYPLILSSGFIALAGLFVVQKLSLEKPSDEV